MQVNNALDSPSIETAAAAAPQFGIEIIDYSINGDTNFCESHVFTIRVWIGQHMYALERSYADFCQFHSALQKRFPKTSLPEFPLSGITQYLKMKHKIKGKGGGNKALVVDSRLSLGRESIRDSRPSVFKLDTSEVVSHKKVPLTNYIEALFKIPDLAASENVIWFLDEESEDGSSLENELVTSEVDILLQGETPNIKSVNNNFVISLNVDAGNVVVWQFSTKNYDIGFELQFNDSEINKYQRYNSHLEAIQGSMSFHGSGKFKLIWDNSYSIMRSKSLTYVIKVYYKAEYDAAKAICTEFMKDKERYGFQRQLLRKTLMKAMVIDSANSGQKPAFTLRLASPVKRRNPATPIRASASDEDLHGQFGGAHGGDNLLEKLSKLEDEKRSLQLAMAASESAMAQERCDRAQLEVIDFFGICIYITWYFCIDYK